MNSKFLVTAVAFAAALSAGATSFAFAAPSREVITSASLGKGTVTLWREGGRLGASIDAAALASLPATETRVDLPVPGAARFRLVEIDWHPHGHPPKGIYDVPHFDAHFYVIEASQRDRIAFAAPGTVAKPAGNLVPAGYVTDGSVVPQMGMHFVPASAPEFHGRPFGCTEIFGYDTGRFAFVEAMFSKRFADEGGSFSQVIPHPAGIAGSLPSRMDVARNAQTGAYDIALSN